MIVSAKIAGFQFETDELKRFGDVTCSISGYTVKCILTLIKE